MRLPSLTLSNAKSSLQLPALLIERLGMRRALNAQCGEDFAGRHRFGQAQQRGLAHSVGAKIGPALQRLLGDIQAYVNQAD